MLHSLNESLQFQLVIGPDYEMNFIQTTHCSSHKTELQQHILKIQHKTTEFSSHKTKYKIIQQQQHTTNLNIKPFNSSILLIAAVDRT
jgi:hypothetical protein